jgi:cell wall assembly regulator SMI1
MSPLIETLKRIISFLERSHPIMVGIAQSLQPGLSQEDITSKLEDFPYTLPNEVIEIYQWRNGQRGNYSDGLAPYYRFLSLEDALREYRILVELAMEFAEEDLPWQKLYDPCWFPIFKEDSNYYVVCTSLEPQESSVILDRSEYLGNDDVWKAEVFPDLTSMLLAVTECWETGAYYTAKNIRGEDYLSIAFAKSSEIWLKYQPKRKRAVELLIDGRKLELSKEELVRAYYDLVAIHHPRAKEILERDTQAYAEIDRDFPDRLDYLLQELRRQQESG